MTGSRFGHLFSVTTFGESHGPALGAIVDGCPPGLPLDASDLQIDLDRRRPGQSRHTSQRREADRVEILSGVFEGVTTGTAIGLLIPNTDARPGDYREIAEVLRPGHGDYAYLMKYGRRDFRGGGRASARETAMRVAAGAIARKYLALRMGIEIVGWLDGIGSMRYAGAPPRVRPDNDFFVPEERWLAPLAELIETLRREGDSVGARVGVIAYGVPAGWGDPVFDKLDATLAHALMSIGAVKAVEIGDGVNVAFQRGSEHRDAMTPHGFVTNHAGGVLAGISTGQAIRAYLAFKPTSSIRLPIATVGTDGQPRTLEVKGRHDPCVGIRGVPIAEAMMALTLMDHALRQRGQNGAVTQPMRPIPGTEDGE
ncbi:chorismate synthase [mine drainage metagenome]|uniref:chorismate synthase n=2 Tax=mine drainage metagenome TaxID=410659 RepID=T1C3W3_9ZZZZ